MIVEVEKLIDKYLSWLKEEITIQQINKDWVEITTPYLDRHNDYLQIYAKRDNRGYLLTDDGYIVTDLEQSGCNIQNSEKRQNLLKTTLNGFGVQYNDKRLEIHSSLEKFSLCKHNLLQAMIAINDMFYMAEPIVSSIFHEDVIKWLDLNEIRYIPEISFKGKSGYDHNFDFAIPKSKDYPERIIRAINLPNRTSAQALTFAWLDTKEVRPINSSAYAILNDSEKIVSESVIEALKNYDIGIIRWSQRKESLSYLTN